MRRTFSPRTQGVLLIAIGAAAIVLGILIEVFDKHMDSFLAYRTPVSIAVGVVAIVVGIWRVRRATGGR